MNENNVKNNDVKENEGVTKVSKEMILIDKDAIKSAGFLAVCGAGIMCLAKITKCRIKAMKARREADKAAKILYETTSKNIEQIQNNNDQKESK